MSIYKLARVAAVERQQMPFETLVRAFFRAEAKSKCIAANKAPDSVKVVTADNLGGYVREITRRIFGMYKEETVKASGEQLGWDNSELKAEASLEFKPETKA